MWREWPTLTAVASIVLLGLALRLVSLPSIPGGLHGDEAVVGLEAGRILEDGWIGLYSPQAAGQPTGPLYLFAPATWLFGNDIFGLRLVSALVGTLTAALAFILLRHPLGFTGAFVAALLLTATVWHLHYSRIAFPIIFWPLVVLIIQWTLVRAFDTRLVRWWAAAGALTASGVYVYNAHWMFGLAIALGGLLYLVANRQCLDRRDVVNVGVASSCALFVLLPVLAFVADDESVYSDHFERDALAGSEAWQAADIVSAQASLLTDRYLHVWRTILGMGERDVVDAGGVIPLVSLPLLVLAAYGAAIGWRDDTARWWWLLSIVVIAVMPLASVFTLDGVPRRPFAMVMSLVVLAGVGVADVQRRLTTVVQHRALFTRGFAPFAASLVLLFSLPALYNYFSTFATDSHQRWVFVDNFTRASLYMDRVDATAYVLVSSPRHSIGYETRQFLAPGVEGSDWAGTRRELGPEEAGNDVVVVLVGTHRTLKPKVLEEGGVVLVSSGETDGRFAALCLRCSERTLSTLRSVALP